MKARQAGFTLVELLVSFVIVVALLGLITAAFTSSRDTYDDQAEIAERQQAELISVGQLSYEIGLAGYRGTDDEAIGRSFANPTYEVNEIDTDSDAVTVRYFEDRWTANGTPMLQQIEFSVADGVLIRTDLADPTNPLELVDGITSLEVTQYVKNDGFLYEVEPDEKSDVVGLTIELTFNNNTPSDPDDDTTQNMSIGFNNEQQGS